MQLIREGELIRNVRLLRAEVPPVQWIEVAASNQQEVERAMKLQIHEGDIDDLNA